MMTISNGHSFTVACASGALDFGTGYWWEKHGLIPLGIIDPSLFTIITKTITLNPRKGNRKWWPPCVLPFFDGGAINAVGLTNPGLAWLVTQYQLGNFPINGLPTIVSIMAEHKTDAVAMARELNKMPLIKGIEVNVSCPNISHQLGQDKAAHIIEIFRAVKNSTSLPVGIKLGWHDPFPQVCRILDGIADWFDLINTIKWSFLQPRKRSPLSWFGYEGGVSGPKIKNFARAALGYTMRLTTPTISGGGIMTAEEGIWRLEKGHAKAITIGSAFLTRPWTVNRIAKGVLSWESKSGSSKSLESPTISNSCCN